MQIHARRTQQHRTTNSEFSNTLQFTAPHREGVICPVERMWWTNHRRYEKTASACRHDLVCRREVGDRRDSAYILRTELGYQPFTGHLAAAGPTSWAFCASKSESKLPCVCIQSGTGQQVGAGRCRLEYVQRLSFLRSQIAGLEILPTSIDKGTLPNKGACASVRPMSDLVPQAVRDLLALYTERHPEVRFADLDISVLKHAVELIDAAAKALTIAEAATKP